MINRITNYYNFSCKRGFTVIEVFTVIGIVVILASVSLTVVNFDKLSASLGDMREGYYLHAMSSAFNQYSVERWGKHVEDDTTPFVQIPVGEENAVAICDEGIVSEDCLSADPLIPKFIAYIPKLDDYENDILSGYGVYINEDKRAVVTRNWIAWIPPVEDEEGDDGEDVLFDCEMDESGRKYLICHVPPGNPERAHTIRLPETAARNHLNKFDDSCGPCEDE